MKLTKEQGVELLKKLTAEKPSQTCPLCGCQAFSVNDTVFNLTENTGKTLTIGKGVSFIPVISASCQKCGYMIFINGLISGIITDEDLENYKDPD